MRGEMRRAPSMECDERAVISSIEHHSDSDFFTQQRITLSERTDVDGCGESLDDGIHVSWIDLHASLVDLLALATPQIKVPAIVEQADVARREPAFRHDLGRQIGPVQIALHERRRADPD